MLVSAGITVGRRVTENGCVVTTCTPSGGCGGGAGGDVVWVVCGASVFNGTTPTTGVVETFTGAFVATCNGANPRKNPYPATESPSVVRVPPPPARQGETRRAPTSSTTAILRTKADRKEAWCPVENPFMDETIIVN
jgi:hypothetical protein